MKSKKSLITLIKIPKITDDCVLCFAQNLEHVPFSIRRVYYIMQAKTVLPRGHHAHYKNRQVLFCIQGSIKLLLNDGKRKEEIILDQPEVGILLDKMVWHEMHDFQPDTILLVLASRAYEPKDYIRDYDQFLKLTGKNNATD